MNCPSCARKKQRQENIRNLGVLDDRWRGHDEDQFVEANAAALAVYDVKGFRFQMRQVESAYLWLTVDATSAAFAAAGEVQVFGRGQSEKQRQETVIDSYQIDGAINVGAGAQFTTMVGYLKAQGFDEYFVRVKTDHAGLIKIRWGYRVHDPCGCVEAGLIGQSVFGGGLLDLPPGG